MRKKETGIGKAAGRSLCVLLLTGAIFSGHLCAQEEAASLGVDLDTTYASRYLWRGYDMFDDHAAIHPSVNVDLFGSGFSVNAWGAIPMGSGSEALTEFDYTVAYGFSLFEDKSYALDVGLNYIYYDFPRVNSKFVPDCDEVGIGLALPKLLTLCDSALVPTCYVGKLWAHDSDIGFDVAGTYYAFGLAYDVPIPDTKMALSLSADINYNDGLFGADHDWSHSTLGVSTSTHIGPFAVTPFLRFQISMDDSVNPEDELVGGVSVALSF